MSIFSSVLRFCGRNVRISRQISSCLSVSSQVLNLSKQSAIFAHVSYEKSMMIKGFSKGLSTHIERQPHSEDFFLRQLFDRESCTYTYLLADAYSKDAVLIDPVIELIERDLEVVGELGLNIRYALSTHMHSDHTKAVQKLKKYLPECKTAISAASGAIADILVRHGDIIHFGRHNLEVRATPGHTNCCVTYVCHDQGVAFTGDTLLIRGCGRTDFDQGDPETLYNSIYNQIFSLPNKLRLYPGHDYRGRTVTTVYEEKRYNPRLTKSREEFIQIMKTLNFAHATDNQMEHSLPESFK
uniref:Persulfide dioxygenase ETHE1, mitochondrial n=1 Tax=Daphnia galeata TaxID=27404 RepID=A0A8J2WII9_9CRUS|nr:unnamed protein product [Daphnia galeata]